MTALLSSRAFELGSRGRPSRYMGRLPSFASRNSPVDRSLMVACRRLIRIAGPSRLRSTSTQCACDKDWRIGGSRNDHFQPTSPYSNSRKVESRNTLSRVERPIVISLERTRNRTRRPRRTAIVRGSKSGGLIPVTLSTNTRHFPASASPSRS